MTIACKNTFEKLVVTVWAPRILLQKGEIAKRKKKSPSIHFLPVIHFGVTVGLELLPGVTG